MRILAFSDLHHSRRRAEALVTASAEADLVIGAGDFCNMRQDLAGAMNLLGGIDQHGPALVTTRTGDVEGGPPHRRQPERFDPGRPGVAALVQAVTGAGKPVGAICIGAYTVTGLISDVHQLFTWPKERLEACDRKAIETKYQTESEPGLPSKEREQ